MRQLYTRRRSLRECHAEGGLRLGKARRASHMCVALLRGHFSRNGMRPVALGEDGALSGIFRKIKIDGHTIDNEFQLRLDVSLKSDLERKVDAERSGQLE